MDIDLNTVKSLLVFWAALIALSLAELLITARVRAGSPPAGPLGSGKPTVLSRGREDGQAKSTPVGPEARGGTPEKEGVRG